MVHLKKHLACGTLIKQIHDGLEKRANNSLRSQNLTMVQVDALFELRFAPEKKIALSVSVKLDNSNASVSAIF